MEVIDVISRPDGYAIRRLKYKNLQSATIMQQRSFDKNGCASAISKFE